MIRAYTIVLFSALLLCFSGYSETFSGKVVAITDGDTIKVMRYGSEVKVRLWGIDAPEKNQAFGTKAKTYLSNKVYGKQVTIDIKDTDRYGRTVGVVISGKGENVNNAIVKDGYAWWYQQYAPRDMSLRKGQHEAQKNRKGLWSDSAPIPPWEFRRKPKSQSPKQSTNRTPAQNSPSTKVESKQSQPQSITVYVTKMVKKYHRDGCRYLSKSKYARTLSSVKGSYSACSACRP